MSGIVRSAVVLLFALFVAPAMAQVVALGASNTDGWGVGRAAAFPAQLEQMLRADGYAVTVVNAGVSGDGTGQMLARLDAATQPGVRLVLLDVGGGLFNNWRLGVERGQGPKDIAAMEADLAAKGLKFMEVHTNLGMPPEDLQADRLHLTPEGHRRLAARLLPAVERALGARR
jgi:acyl-CoA thioesterase-1